ncbi:g2471 [Coccomyxa viridis]|uniref:G2471 protein n=1 Tax=Coccomyxa viridis TaxID=1274662 RepID=A0ABP1FSJ5_9CHLO
MSLDGRPVEQPAGEYRMQHLSRLEQGAADHRQHPSIQSAPEAVTHKLHYQYQDLSDRHPGQEALTFSSSAPAHLTSHLPPVRTSHPSLLQQQEAADSRSNLSEADTYEPGSIPTTAHSSPVTPPGQVSPAFPLTPPPAPLKQPRSQPLPPGYCQTAASLLGEPSAKRSLQPAFNAAAAQAGMPLCDLQPFEPLLLGEADAGSLTPHHTGSDIWQRRQLGRAAMHTSCRKGSDGDL